MKNNIVTWFDVIMRLPNHFNPDTGLFSGITKGDILAYIQEEEAMIRAILKPYYGTNLTDGVLRLRTHCSSTNVFQDLVITSNDLTVTNPTTQVYKIEFTDPTHFVVKTDFDGNFSGVTNADTVMTDITLKLGTWTGHTFGAGELIYLCTRPYENLLINLVVKNSAARLLEEVFVGEASTTSANAKLWRDEVTAMLNKLTNDSIPNMLSGASKTTNTTLTPISLGYVIDRYGEDQTEYLSSDLDDYEY